MRVALRAIAAIAAVCGYAALDRRGLTIGLTIPVLEHLTGQRQDVSQFAVVHGNPGVLAHLLALSWTLAAIGKEVTDRGFLLTRLVQTIGGGLLLEPWTARRRARREPIAAAAAPTNAQVSL